MMRVIAISLFFLWGHAALAASSVIVDDKDVADAIARNALVWDVRPADAYARGHIAGACCPDALAKGTECNSVN
jgi:rhodanese-related sulfurtransferase